MSGARAFAFLFLSALAFPASAQLPAQVAQALAAAKVPQGNVAVVVQEVGAKRAALELNAAVAMNPASVMKLLTTQAALELLGPAYRWKTEASLDGENLTLRGTGDPKLDLEAFWKLLRALRGKGLRDIRGDLILDRSHFEAAAGDAGRFDGDAMRPYNVLPDALLVNYKSLRFAFSPDASGAVRLFVEPRPPALDVVNVLRLVEGACPEGQAFRDMLRPTFEPGRQRAVFTGQFPAACGEKDLNVALLEPNDHVAGTFRQLWAELGGSWQGAARDGTVSPAARLLHVHESPALAELLRDMNKFSNNVMARQIFLTIGAEAAGAPANTAKSAAAIRAWLSRRGIAAPELVIENGSGLSRAERMSAASLAALLQAAWSNALMPEFASSMPVLAVDGTMRRRLRGEGAAGQAHIKSGLLSDVRSMAGYVLSKGGRRYAVVMLVNHSNAHQTQPALDALLRWVHEH